MHDQATPELKLALVQQLARWCLGLQQAHPWDKWLLLLLREMRAGQQCTVKFRSCAEQLLYAVHWPCSGEDLAPLFPMGLIQQEVSTKR